LNCEEARGRKDWSSVSIKLLGSATAAHKAQVTKIPRFLHAVSGKGSSMSCAPSHMDVWWGDMFEPGDSGQANIQIERTPGHLAKTGAGCEFYATPERE